MSAGASPLPASSGRTVRHRPFRSTNAVESMISICRDHSANVKRWRDGQMALRLSTRRYPVALEPVGQRTETAATSTSRSAVSRRFVAQTETAALLSADLSGLDLALAAELDRTHPGAAASLREGMDETLTVLRLNLPPTLARTGAPPGWSRPASSSAASTATCTCDPYATRWTGSPDLSAPPTILNASKPPDDHRAATEVPRTSGHPRMRVRWTHGQQVTWSTAWTSRLSRSAIRWHASSVGMAVRSTCRRPASLVTSGMIGSEP